MTSQPYRINWRRIAAHMFRVMACLQLLFAVVDLIMGQYSDAGTAFALCAAYTVINGYLNDRAHLHDYAEVTRTYRNGHLTTEHRTGSTGVQSGTFYGWPS